jgi:hypothetical protein
VLATQTKSHAEPRFVLQICEMINAAWTIREEQAALSTPSLSAVLDLSAPHSGLHGLIWNQMKLDVDFLGVELPETASINRIVRDAYCRVDDLVVTYADTSQWQLRPQIYWRYCDRWSGSCVGVELIASLQTSLLDAPADIATISRVAADEMFYLSAHQHDFRELARSAHPQCISPSLAVGCFVFRLTSANVSYVELIHPSDFRETLLEAVPELQVDEPAALCRHRLFGRRLEKGVILRGRVLGLFMPQDDDLRLARKCYQSFAESEPVLTA